MVEKESNQVPRRSTSPKEEQESHPPLLLGKGGSEKKAETKGMVLDAGAEDPTLHFPGRAQGDKESQKVALNIAMHRNRTETDLKQP